MSVDYRELLKRYMSIAISAESQDYWRYEDLTDEERSGIDVIEAEIADETRRDMEEARRNWAPFPRIGPSLV